MPAIRTPAAVWPAMRAPSDHVGRAMRATKLGTLWCAASHGDSEGTDSEA